MFCLLKKRVGWSRDKGEEKNTRIDGRGAGNIRPRDGRVMEKSAKCRGKK